MPLLCIRDATDGCACAGVPLGPVPAASVSSINRRRASSVTAAASSQRCGDVESAETSRTAALAAALDLQVGVGGDDFFDSTV